MSACEVRAERLLGRRVRALNGRAIGRIEDMRVERVHDEQVVTGYVIGAAGWRERLDLAGGHHTARLARWDQLDISDPGRPRLTCPVDALERFVPGNER